MSGRLIVPREILWAIERHAVRQLPFESGGILLGRVSGVDRLVVEFTALRSAEPSARHYLAIASECVQAVYRARSAMLEVVATVHSHPGADCTPSATDLLEAYGYDCCWHLIVGFAACAAEFQAYQYHKEKDHLFYTPITLVFPHTLQHHSQSIQ